MIFINCMKLDGKIKRTKMPASIFNTGIFAKYIKSLNIRRQP